MCIFPKVLIIIMFMGGAKLALGGRTLKFFSRYAQKWNRAPRGVNIDFISRPPPEQNPEYASEHIEHFL